MTQKNSILDKVMASQQMQEASQFIPSEFILKLLKNLNTKEKEIITKRFGLDGQKKQTLEEIGKDYQITRERIRQIQMAAIKKIKELQEIKTEIESIETLIIRLLEEHGGIMEENYLLEKLLNYSEDNTNNRQAASFILDHLMGNRMERLTSNEHLIAGWKTDILATDKIIEILNILYQITEIENKLLTLEQVVEKFKSHNFYNENLELFSIDFISNQDNNKEVKNLKKIIESYLIISQKLDKNIMNEWGLKKWTTIIPKRMSDKVYMILRKEKRPLHFKEIADLINKTNFDQKVAHPATIHNELILNDKFVLIGRGIYALAEWGYKSGTVADVIRSILEKSQKPLSKENITDQVLQTRIVKKSTINLALTDKNKFKKVTEGYTLVE